MITPQQPRQHVRKAHQSGDRPRREQRQDTDVDDETALRINWYLPINSRMNAPDMPGRIIAQMAIAPDSRMNHHVSGVCDGATPP